VYSILQYVFTLDFVPITISELDHIRVCFDDFRKGYNYVLLDHNMTRPNPIRDMSTTYKQKQEAV
jgi:hypothetical protein